MTTRKTVLIVGGGGAGARLARALSERLLASKHKILLVSSHPFYIHYPACLRLLVTGDGSLEDRAFIPYDKLFVNGNGEFKQGTVAEIKAERGSMKGGEIVLQNGESISYDVLVLAPGSRAETFLTFPCDHELTRAHIEKWRTKFRDAKKVVIAGGGAVGIELAGELRDFYPDTQVTIVHGNRKLLNATYPNKFRIDVERRMRASKVKLVLDDYIDEFPAVSTRKGTPLDADLIVPARGPRPNTEFIVESLGPDVVTKSQFVKIKPTFQLPLYPNIFALGDVTDYLEQKQVTKYAEHASLVAANIMSFLYGVEPTKEYNGTLELIFITNGRKGGATFANILWGLMFGNGVTSILKSRELNIGYTRRALGLAT